MSSYTEENIRSLTGLEIVRTRPNAFLPDREIAGLVHQAVEPIVNSIDEIALMPEGVGLLNVLVCLDAARQTYQVVIIDNGRGVPIGSATSLGMVECYTQMNTSGKYDTKAYETSGGLLGMGAKVSVGTSVDARAITHVGDRQASLYVHEGEIVGELKVEPAPSPATGTTMFYEPDPKIFTSIELFGEQGLPRLLLLLQKFCYFRRLSISLRVYHVGLPADIWKRSIRKTDAILQSYWTAAEEIFTEPMFDRTAWLKAYWNIQRPFMLHHGMKNAFQTTVMENRVPKEVTARYEIQLYTVKFDQTGGRFGMLNNLPIDDPRSTHMASVIDAVKELMAAEIADKAVKNWFRETYKLAINIAVEIKCPGAEPSGTTKDAFMSSTFRRGYLPSLLATLQLPEGLAFIKAFYAEIATDIEDKYNLAMTGVPKVKNVNRLFEDLNHSDKYLHCSTTDRSKAELFLVEGDSALNAEGRDSETQGIYALRGKPMNGIMSADKRATTIKDILDNDIYQDIIKILNLTPNRFDPSSMFYNRLMVTTDADDHGYHISSILVGNLYVLCPALVESGMIHIVMPPLYGLDYTAGRKVLPRVYMRDDQELNAWLAHEVYYKAIKLGVRSPLVFTKTRWLSELEYIAFVQLVVAIGQAITNIAGELVLPPLVVEMLTHITQYLDPGKVDVERIRAITGFERVHYDHHGHILIITHGKDDYIIPLQNVSTRLRATVLPMLNRIAWTKLGIYITTLHTPMFKDRMVSVMQLYEVLKTLDTQFYITRYKGLGSMPASDIGRTCMDPARRRIHQITSIGDVDVIFRFLGQDPTGRQNLLRKA